MPHSDDYGISDDDTEFLAVATQVEAQNHTFEPSPRPPKRRRLQSRVQAKGKDTRDDVESEFEEPAPRASRRRSKPTPARKQKSTAATRDALEPETDDEYYFDGELDDDAEAKKQSKYKIHVPKSGSLLPNVFFASTQVGLDEDPAVIRGPVWKRPTAAATLPLAQQSVNTFRNSAGQNDCVTGKPTVRASVGSNLNDFVERSDGRISASTLQPNDQARAIDRQMTSNGASRTLSEPTPAITISQELADLPSDAFSSSSPTKSPVRDIIEVSSQTGVNARPLAAPHGLRAPQAGLKQMTIFGQPATQNLTATQAAKKKHAWPLKQREEAPTHHKLEHEALEKWIYPTNLGTIRDYQFNIVSRSLYSNTLVALPTGLGKTFIAATVMLNYFQWTKDAQIIFMAPTKPLIAQQMEACYGIAGIHRRDTVLMTGETTPAIRAEEWLEKRVFFMTPQTVINDLKTGICDPKKIVLVVVDEAHKATGGYAYTEVVSFLRRFNNSFRVLALTATPGSTVEAVQSVIDNLGIARVELRTENSIDIRQYTHEKHTETEVFDFSEEQKLIMDHLGRAIQPVLDKLSSQNAYWSRDPMQLTAYGLTTSRQRWSQTDAGRKASFALKGMVNAVFTTLAQLAHGLQLLKFHGIAPFYTHIRAFQHDATKKYAKQISESRDFTKAVDFMRAWTNHVDFIGHPKLQYLREVVMNHFLDAGEGIDDQVNPPRPTRIMIFTSFRDSTDEICRVLKRNEPLVRPHVFVGQAASKGSEGMNQKKQNEVIQDFKNGKYNTLVATSIGEEGLDIGDVDLIICYDASSSPIRMLQRIGRTGRKRVGRVVLLLMRSKEENDYAKAQDNYAYIQKTIADDSKYSYRDDQSSRIIPKEYHPVVEKKVIDIPVENSQPIDLNEKGRRKAGKAKTKRPPKKFHMPDGVRTGFVSASALQSDDDGDNGERSPRKPAVKRQSIPKKLPPPPEPEPAQIPFLDDVLLSSAQDRDHERRYTRTAYTDENAVVRAPDPANDPESLRKIGQTKYVSHGRVAVILSHALQAVHDLDESHAEQMKAADRMDDGEFDIAVRARLVSPEAEDHDVVVELPKPRQPAPKASKPRARPRKKTIQRTESYGSAMEGNDSSPEPTPADMRIGTQGIDLGSRDTSGEDEDEEPDSELEEFIVGSDQPIEMASSSQLLVSSSLPASQESAARPKARGRLVPRARTDIAVIEEESDERDESDVEETRNAPESASSSDSASSIARERSTKITKKKRAVSDSDDDK